MRWDLVGPGLSRDDRRILFVFGAARSGTTMLNNLLYKHFDYGMGPEGTFIGDFASKLPRYGDLDDERNLRRLVEDVSNCRMLYIARHKYRRNPFDVTPELILQNLPERSYAGVVYSVLQCVADLQNRKNLGNKNPGYWQQLGLLGQLFPSQARFLCIVRDGRDVALSNLKTSWGQSSAYSCARQWVRVMKVVRELQESKHPVNLHVLRYEDLLSASEQTLAGVCDFLQLPVGGDSFEAAVTEVSSGQKRMNFNKWRHEMSERDLRLYEGIAGDLLDYYGYDLGCRSSQIGPLDHTYYRTKEFSRLLHVNLKHKLFSRSSQK